MSLELWGWLPLVYRGASSQVRVVDVKNQY
jgi:hypothetical protein